MSPVSPQQLRIRMAQPAQLPPQPAPAISPLRPRIDHSLEPNCRCATSNAERLRRFLAFCLSIDYGLVHESRNHQPLKQDFIEFVQLASLCLANKRPLPGWDGKDLVYDDSVHVWMCKETRIECELLEPANRLGIGHGVVLSILRTWVGSVRHASYRSRVKWIGKMYGRKTLAAKLLYDRKTLIAKVVRDPRMRQKMLGKNLEISEAYFKRPDGIIAYPVLDYSPEAMKEVFGEKWKVYEKELNGGNSWFKGAMAKKFALVTDVRHVEQVVGATWMHAVCEFRLWWPALKKKKEIQVPEMMEKEKTPMRPRRRTAEKGMGFVEGQFFPDQEEWSLLGSSTAFSIRSDSALPMSSGMPVRMSFGSWRNSGMSAVTTSSLLGETPAASF